MTQHQAPIVSARRVHYRGDVFTHHDYLVAEDCPYCGSEHTHGGGDPGSPPGVGDGHRTAHCHSKAARPGYILREVETDDNRCHAITRAGQQCKRRARDGRKRCQLHDAARQCGADTTEGLPCRLPGNWGGGRCYHHGPIRVTITESIRGAARASGRSPETWVAEALDGAADDALAQEDIAS